MGKDFALFKASSDGISKSFARTNMNGTIPMARTSLSYSFSSLQISLRRGFSSSSELPHQEIGIPSLSPTVTEDKATVEMECTEEGSITEIVHDDGAKDIKVGDLQAEAPTRLYFVCLGLIPHEDPNVEAATYHDILSTVLGSKEKAVSAIHCSLDVFSGFMAMLTESQANALAELPEVLDIRPDQFCEFHWKVE